MKKDVKIKICSTQNYEDCDEDKISFETDGVFYKKDHKYYIKYVEDENSGTKGTKATLKIEKNRVMLIRNGQTSSQMTFVENEEYNTKYETIAGAYMLNINTKKVENNITDNGGTLFLDYEIGIQEQSSGRNTFKLELKTEN